MNAIIENVTVTGGRVKGTTATSLNVSIPSGMSGASLLRWKAKNEKAIIAAIADVSEPEGDDADDTGDSNVQA